MAFDGSCHCGAVTFTVNADTPTQAVSCNCSHCRRKGLLLAFFAPEQFKLHQGDTQLRTYLFNKHRIEHRYCVACGTEPFAQGVGPDGKPMRAINLRCVPGVDLDTLKLQKYDGASA
ncbi:MAG: hypothetical protein JWP52_916 [Rhizobacter sp.]|jgi:hypothetical protein|nr:hypothetical protein [Rhizobacter sp.]